MKPAWQKANERDAKRHGKPTREQAMLTRLFREVYAVFAWGEPWPWVRGERRCFPALMTTGTTSETTPGRWQQTSFAA